MASRAEDKVCSTCKRERPLNSFVPDKRRWIDGRGSECRSCKRQRTQLHYQDNLDMERARSRVKRRVYYWDNREIELAKNAAWYATHSEYNSIKSATYNDRKRAQSVGDIQEIMDYKLIIKNDPCAYCGAPCEAFDHIDPLLHGGDHAWDNLTPSCKSCNSSKRDTSVLIWMLR